MYVLDSEQGNFNLFGLIYSLYLRKIELLGAPVVEEERCIHTYMYIYIQLRCGTIPDSRSGFGACALLASPFIACPASAWSAVPVIFSMFPLL